MCPGRAGSHGMMRTPQPSQSWVGVVTPQGNGAKRLDGKKIKKPREEEHTKAHSRGFHALAGGELSFHLSMVTSETEI